MRAASLHTGPCGAAVKRARGGGAAASGRGLINRLTTSSAGSSFAVDCFQKTTSHSTSTTDATSRRLYFTHTRSSLANHGADRTASSRRRRSQEELIVEDDEIVAMQEELRRAAPSSSPPTSAAINTMSVTARRESALPPSHSTNGKSLALAVGDEEADGEGRVVYAKQNDPSSFSYRLQRGLYHHVSDLLSAPYCPHHPVDFLTQVLEAEGARLLLMSMPTIGNDERGNGADVKRHSSSPSPSSPSPSSPPSSHRVDHVLVTSMLKDTIERITHACEAVDAVGDVQSGKEMAEEMKRLSSIRELLSSGGKGEEEGAKEVGSEDADVTQSKKHSSSSFAAAAFSLKRKSISEVMASVVSNSSTSTSTPSSFSQISESSVAAAVESFNEWVTPIRVKLLQAELAACAKVGWWQNAFLALQDLLEEERYQVIKKQKEHQQQRQQQEPHDGSSSDAAALYSNASYLSSVVSISGWEADPTKEEARKLRDASNAPLRRIVSPNHYLAALESCGARNSRAFDVAHCVYTMAIERYGEAIAVAAKDRMIKEGSINPTRITPSSFQQKQQEVGTGQGVDEGEDWVGFDDVVVSANERTPAMAIDGAAVLGAEVRSSNTTNGSVGGITSTAAPPRELEVVSDDLHASLLRHLAKSIATNSDMSQFRELFRSPIVADTVPVSVPLYTAIMEGCEQAVGMANKVEFCVALYRSLRDSQLTPAAETYTALMGVCAEEKETTTAFAYYREALAVLSQPGAEASGGGVDTLPPRFYTNLLRAYASAGYAADAKTTFEVLKEAGAPLERLAYHVVLSSTQSVRDAAALIEEAAQVSGLLSQPTSIGTYLITGDPTLPKHKRREKAEGVDDSIGSGPSSSSSFVCPMGASPITNLPPTAVAVTPTTLSYLVSAHAKSPEGSQTMLSLCDIHHHAVAFAAEEARSLLAMTSSTRDTSASSSDSSSSMPIAVSVANAHRVLCARYPSYVKAVEDALFSTVVDFSVRGWRVVDGNGRWKANRGGGDTTASAADEQEGDSANILQQQQQFAHGSIRGLVSPSLIAMVQHNMTHNFLLGQASPQRPSFFPVGHRPLVAVLTAEVLADLDVLFEPYAKYFSSIVIPFSQLVRFKRDCGIEEEGGPAGGRGGGSDENAIELVAASAPHSRESRIDESIYNAAMRAHNAEEAGGGETAASTGVGTTKALSPEEFIVRGSERRNRLLTFLNKYKSVTHLMSLEEELQMSPDVKCYGIPIKSMPGRAVAVAANLARGITGVAHNDGSTVGVGTLYAEADAKFYVVSPNYKDCGQYIKANIILRSRRGVPVDLSSEMIKKVKSKRQRNSIQSVSDYMTGAGVRWLNPEQNPNWRPLSTLSIPAHVRKHEEDVARQRNRSSNYNTNEEEGKGGAHADAYDMDRIHTPNINNTNKVILEEEGTARERVTTITSFSSSPLSSPASHRLAKDDRHLILDPSKMIKLKQSSSSSSSISSLTGTTKTSSFSAGQNRNIDDDDDGGAEKKVSSLSLSRGADASPRDTAQRGVVSNDAHSLFNDDDDELETAKHLQAQHTSTQRGVKRDSETTSSPTPPPPSVTDVVAHADDLFDLMG